MLSYRHSFHAGNFADVLKHTVQTLIIEALKQKPKAFVYYDTHAGAGKYSLFSKYSRKNAEYKEGIEKIWLEKNSPEEISHYIDLIKKLNPDEKLTTYPGSPLVAHMLMSKQNRLELSELHPTDHALLEQEFNHLRSINVVQADGYKHLKRKLPPIQRRGLVLIDPPYELKNEYDDVIKNIKQAHNLFATGIYAVWYPVVSRHHVERFCNQFKTSGIKNILRIELNVKEDSNEHGMTGTGMIIINPPWKLEQQMQNLMPWLLENLKQDNYANFIIEQIVKE
jgi:23S rRNA (adenine2030-N6)-methyltransferase